MHFPHHYLYSVALTVLASAITSCSGTSNKTSTENTPDGSTLTPEKVISLFKGVDEFDNTPEKVMTPQLYALYHDACEIPSDGFGDMDTWCVSRIDLITIDDFDSLFISDAKIESIQGDTALATVTLRFIIGQEKNDFFDDSLSVTLAKNQSQWLIDDYDYSGSLREKLINYIENQRQLFRSKKWPTIINKYYLKYNGYYHTVAQTLKDIDQYFKKYPMPNDATDISDEEILDLFHAIPGFWDNDSEWICDTVKMKKCFSDSTYRLIDHLMHTPTTDFEGIPSDLWVCHWVRSRPGGEYDPLDDEMSVMGCHAEYINDSLIAQIELIYKNAKTPEYVEDADSHYYYDPMRLYLIRENGKWVIQDFYNRGLNVNLSSTVQNAGPWTTNCIRAYIQEVRSFLRSDQWKEENRNILQTSDSTTLEKAKKYLESIEQYFELYPG